MWKYLSLVVIASVVATASWSQDDAADPAEAQAAPAPVEDGSGEDAAADPADAQAAPAPVEDESGEDAAAADEEELGDLILDDPELDEQGYAGDDDEFIPTEEIPVDQAIPFPSDI